MVLKLGVVTARFPLNASPYRFPIDPPLGIPRPGGALTVMVFEDPPSKSAVNFLKLVSASWIRAGVLETYPSISPLAIKEMSALSDGE